MKAFFAKMSRRNKIILGVAAVVVLLLIFVIGNRGKGNANSPYQTVTAKRGQLTATIGATGTVRAAQSAILNWQTTGTVGDVNVQVGDQVKKDDVLASLRQDSLPQADQA